MKMSVETINFDVKLNCNDKTKSNYRLDRETNSQR